MYLMNSKGGSLELYEEVFKWHMRHLETQDTVSARVLHSVLAKRYNLGNTMPVEKRTFLPHAKATIDIVTHDCVAQTVDLLTDPRIREDDYLFFDGDPRKGPPEDFVVLQDVNTGRAFRETYKRVIEIEPITADGRHKVLVGYIFYLDSCVTGQFGSLPIEILKFSLTLLNSEARKHDWAWRNLGYVKTLLKETGQANDLLKASSHVDASQYLKLGKSNSSVNDTPDFDSSLYNYGYDDDESGAEEDEELPEIALQDLHKMLHVMLSGYKKIEQSGGLPWDKMHNGELLHLQLIPFVIFCRVDGVEADKLCGHYGPKTKTIKNICRQCICPTSKAAHAYRTDQLKTQPMIQQLVKSRDEGKLQRISQHRIWNAFYELRFGLHNTGGIHQATPLDMLHWMQLGQLKYSRNCFFDQTGASPSTLTKNLNAVATSVGFLIKRQSDRIRPRTMFTRGIQKGKMMGHEMTGLILVLVATLRSTRGRRYILEEARGKQKDFLPDQRFITDWIKLLETQLQLEQWLCKEELDVQIVERAKTKLKEYMNMTKQVAKREKGMGAKTQNFHGTLHIPDTILDFGVPNNFNTFHNERHHKRDKASSKRTNKRPATFDFMVAEKIQQRLSVDFAIAEINGKKRWKYFTSIKCTDESPGGEPFEPYLGGTKVRVFKENDNDQHWSYEPCTRMKQKSAYKYDEMIQYMICHLGEKLFRSRGIKEFCLYSELTVYDTAAENNKQIYYATPYFDGAPWYDWAIFDMTTFLISTDPADNHVPCQLKCFVDLQNITLANNEQVEFTPGIYVFAEPARINNDPTELGMSEIWSSWTKSPSALAQYANDYNKVHLLNIEDITGPTIVIPDLDNENKRAYLKMSALATWADEFEDWLNEEHTRQFDYPQSRS
jgi:hypothetical protein